MSNPLNGVLGSGGGGGGGTGTIGGSTGATDDAILVADGTGGSTLAATNVFIDSSSVFRLGGANSNNYPALRPKSDNSGTFEIVKAAVPVSAWGNLSTEGGRVSASLISNAPSAAASTVTIYGSASLLQLGTGAGVAWTNNTSSESGSLDTGLARSAAGVVKVTDGSAGNGKISVASDVGNPTYAFTAAAGYGFGQTGSSTLIFSGGERVLSATTTVLGMSANHSLTWNSTNNDSDGSAADTGLARSAAGVVKVTDGSAGIRGLLGGGTSVASASALPVPTGRVFHVTGTTSITSITSTNFQAGAVITLIFDDVLTFTDGNNLKLAGDFTTSADDTITLAYDGTNWYECSRSVN